MGGHGGAVVEGLRGAGNGCTARWRQTDPLLPCLTVPTGAAASLWRNLLAIKPAMPTCSPQNTNLRLAHPPYTHRGTLHSISESAKAGLAQLEAAMAKALTGQAAMMGGIQQQVGLRVFGICMGAWVRWVGWVLSPCWGYDVHTKSPTADSCPLTPCYPPA